MKRYSFWVKSLVFFLAVVTLLSVAVSGLGILMAENLNMYTQDDYEEWMYDRYRNMADTIAHHVMMDYGSSLSDCPQWLLAQTAYADAIRDVEGWFELSSEDWYYTISKGGKTLRSNYHGTMDNDTLHFIFAKECNYPVVGMADDYAEYFRESVTDEPVPVHYETETGYQVDVWISRNYTSTYMNNGLSPSMMQWLFSAKIPLIVIAVVSLILFVVAFVFLVLLAGKDKAGQVNPKALNRMPLDLYLAAAGFITVIGCIGAYELLDSLFYSDSYNVLITILLCICGSVVGSVDMGFFAALAAQFKLRGYYWFTNSICGRLLKLGWKLTKMAYGYIKKPFHFVGHVIGKTLTMLPIVWKWIVTGGIIGIVLLFICATSTAHWYTVFPLVIWCLAFAMVVIYCGYSYGVILKGIKRLKAGDLNEKINTQWLFGSFKIIAEDLNALADVVMIAAEKQLKAERMKTELITNVSHDIKTPLTSVINYVDLLRQPHTEEEGEQYLEVLSRQSVRLKKLVEDLMDMSKASSGNMTVSVTSMDMVEAVNQALGEFADKLDVAELTPVFRPQMPQMKVYADGRLTWRVLSNLLSNVVKYALPGTRVYLDLFLQDGNVILSLKNISREELNISAEELTERFVRGDTSRNTEGSGLGLNIAKSLMHLQRGDMAVAIDGDLFKVTLTFPVQ